MVAALQNGKRKRVVATREPETVEEPDASIPQHINLEMEREGVDTDASSEQDDRHSFPELDPLDDSETEGEYDDVPSIIEDDELSEAEELAAVSDSEDDLKIFPQATTIISRITGEPKVVYPEIDPNYDSDSSTEEVSG